MGGSCFFFLSMGLLFVICSLWVYLLFLFHGFMKWFIDCFCLLLVLSVVMSGMVVIGYDCR